MKSWYITWVLRTIYIEKRVIVGEKKEEEGNKE